MRLVRILASLVSAIALAGCFIERCEWTPAATADHGDASAEAEP